MRLVELGTRARITSGRIDVEMDDGSVVSLRALSEPPMQRIRGTHISMVFQEPLTSLNPVYPVGEQIAEALRIHEGINKKASRARARDMFDLVRIPEAEKRIGQYPPEMSGGMRQRIMIAIALSCNPDVIIADEPTTALDVTVQAQILELIAELREHSGMSVLLITHDLDVVRKTAERVYVMQAGKIIEDGDTASVFRLHLILT